MVCSNAPVFCQEPCLRPEGENTARSCLRDFPSLLKPRECVERERKGQGISDPGSGRSAELEGGEHSH